jgi:hypothetical protein
MFFPEPFLSELPAYVATVSEGSTVLALGHYDQHGGALEWCGRAMGVGRFPTADQIALFRPTMIDWLGVGKVPGLQPVEGWLRTLSGWEPADPRQLLRLFDQLPERLRTLQTDPPTSDTPKPGLRAVLDGPLPGSVRRIAQAPRDALVEVLKQLNDTLTRIADHHDARP